MGALECAAVAEFSWSALASGLSKGPVRSAILRRPAPATGYLLRGRCADAAAADNPPGRDPVQHPDYPTGLPQCDTERLSSQRGDQIVQVGPRKARQVTSSLCAHRRLSLCSRRLHRTPQRKDLVSVLRKKSHPNENSTREVYELSQLCPA